MRRTRLAAWNVASMLAFALATTVTGLAVTPAIVVALGDGPYGATKMVLEYCAHLTLLELAVGGSLGPLLARAAGREDESAVRRTMAAGTRVYLVVAVLIQGVGLALVPWADRLVPVGSGHAADVRWAWAFGVLSYLALGLSPFRALAESGQRGYLVNLLMTAQAIVIAAGSLALARGGAGIRGQLLMVAVGNMLVALSLAADGLRRHPGLLVDVARLRPGPETWRALWVLGAPTFVFSFCGRVALMCDAIIVGTLLAPALVTSLFLTTRLAALAQTQLLGLGNAAWAGLAELHARGDLETFRRRLVELTGLIAVLGLAALGPIAAYNRHFFALWVPEKLDRYGGEAMVVAASANGLLLGLTSFWIWCFSGTGQVRRVVAPVALAAAINLGASIALTRSRGPIGALLGTTLGIASTNLWVLPLLLRRSFGVPLRGLFGAVARPLALGLPYALALRWLARGHQPRGWPGLALEMALGAAGFLALAWLLVLKPDDRALWRFRLSALRPRAL